jgi:rSAM/selenodomain-associated transferase 1
MSSALAIFAKAPIVGQVKTRLCPPLSPETATELYRCFLLDSVARACALVAVDVYLAFTPVGSESHFRQLLPFPVRYVSQRGASLGEREAHVFADLLQAGYEQVVIVGSDIPTLPVAHLQQAFALLMDSRHDVVIGPSEDGGYYLLGARRLHPVLFENIHWSTPTVFAETVAQARRAGLTMAQVPAWYDVDENDDLRKLILELTPPEHAARAPRTRAMLEQLGLLFQ